MAKATVTTAGGATVVIEGSAEEVRDLLTRLKPHGRGRTSARKRGDRALKTRKTLPSMTDGILELRQEGFFRKAKGLAEIKEKLATLGMIYPVTSISGAVLSLVKKRALGRVKEDGRWCYVAR